MHKIEIPDLKLKMEIPSVLSELSSEDYLVFVELFLMLKNGEISYEKFRLVFLNHFFDFQPVKKLSRKNREEIYAEIYRISELFDSFLKHGDDKLELNLNCIKNLLPVISGVGCNLFGPLDALTDITFFEYIDAHSAYYDFVTTQDESALNRLVAILYRPEIENLEKVSSSNDFDGQRRIKYNPHVIDYQVKHVASLPYHVRYAVFLYYNSCEDFLRDGEFPVAGSTIKLSLLYGSSGGNSDDTGLIGVLYTLSESQVFGNAKETADTNLYDVMLRLYQLMKIYKNQEKQLNSDGKNKAV